MSEMTSCYKLDMGSYFQKVPLSHLITCQDPGHPSVFVKNKGRKMGEILCQICYDRQWANKKAQHSFELEKQI